MKSRIRLSGFIVAVFLFLFTSFSFAAGANNYNYSNFEPAFAKVLLSVDKSDIVISEKGADNSGITLKTSSDINSTLKSIALIYIDGILNAAYNYHPQYAIINANRSRNKYDKYNVVAITTNTSNKVVRTSTGVGLPITGFIIRSV